MIELKRLKLINWHNFENVTFDCARLTYMIGVNAVGKTTILDAIRYCLTTNRNFNALGNKKSGRTLQGSVHAKQRGENAYRRPGRTVAYIGAEFWDSVKRTHFVIAVRVESEGPMQELHPGDQTWYISEDGCTLEQLPFIDPRTGAPSSKENFKPAVGRLSYTRSPGEARDRICRALGIGRAASPLGKKFNEVFQMGTSMDEIPNFREFLYQYILPQPELDLEALQGDRVELENLHAVLAEAQTRAAFVSKAILPASIASCTSRYVISFDVDAICVTASSLHAYRISPVPALPSRLPCRKLKYPFSSKCLMSITNGVLVSTISSVCDFNSVVIPNTRPKSTSFIYKPPFFS